MKPIPFIIPTRLYGVRKMIEIPIGNVDVHIQHPYMRVNDHFLAENSNGNDIQSIEFRNKTDWDNGKTLWTTLWIKMVIPDMKYSENFVTVELSKEQLITLRDYINQKLEEWVN